MGIRAKSYDYTLIAVIICLVIFGAIMVYSASIIWAEERLGYPSYYFFVRQLLFLAVSLLLFFFFANFNYRLLKNKKLQVLMIFVAMFSLIAIIFFGNEANNAQSWFKIGAFKLQPSEFCKLAVILYLAAVYSRKQAYINKLNSGIMPPIVFLIIIVGLIALQPDFGTGFITLVVGILVTISSGMNWKSLLKLVALGIVIILLFAPFVYLFQDKIFTEKRMERIHSYTEPFQTEKEGGYQLVQSLIAIGSGKMTGVGFGESSQKYGYLPEPHTDFIMAIIAEELGFIGVAFVLLSLGCIVVKGFIVSVRCNDPFGRMIAVGISSMIGFQAFINLGGVSGVIPITGVTLPFVSYGGSSLIALFISAGILVNISMQTQRKALLKDVGNA